MSTNGLFTLVGANGTSTSVAISRPGGHSITDTITIVGVPGAPTASNATSQTSSSLTFPVTLNASGSLPTSLGWRWSTDNASWTSGADITLSSPTLGQTVNETVSPISGSWSASTLYYVQFKEQNGSGSSSYCASVTGTTSASGTPVGQSVSALYLTEPISGQPMTYSQASPSAPKSVAMATHTGPAQWRAMNASTITGGPTSHYIQSTGGGATQALLVGGWVSDTLSAQTIAGGTYTLSFGGYTESGSAYKLAPSVYIWRPGTDAVVGTIYDNATGLGTATTTNSAAAGRVVTFTGAAVSGVQDGDRLVVEIYWVGTGNDFLHYVYNGTSATVDGGAVGRTELDFPSAIYLQNFGTIRVGPTGRSSTTGALVAVTVASDAEFRSKALPSGAGTLWDTSQTSLKGTASVGYLEASAAIDVDLMSVDTSVTFTDRDSVTRNTLKVLIKPAGGAPVSAANDSLASSSAHPESAMALPPGRTITSFYQRQLVRFAPGFSMTAPNNTTSNASGFNSTQSGAYKLGVFPQNNGTRADFELSGGQNPGSEYWTANFGVIGTTPYNGTTDGNNYYVGALSTVLPAWNTGGDVWEIVRVMRDHGDGTATQAVYAGKVTATYLTKLAQATSTIASGSYPAMTGITICGKNFNRQLASTDATPTLNVSDAEFADITDPNWSWPSQIQVADRI